MMSCTPPSGGGSGPTTRRRGRRRAPAAWEAFAPEGGKADLGVRIGMAEQGQSIPNGNRGSIFTMPRSVMDRCAASSACADTRKLSV